MSARAFTVLVYAAIVSVAFGLELLSRRRRSRIPSLGGFLRGIMRTRSGRVGLVAGWAWLGLHFWAR